jgi:hypothetical protein
VIGECDAGPAEFGGAPAKAVDAARAVEQRVLRVYVEMDELIQAGFL